MESMKPEASGLFLYLIASKNSNPDAKLYTVLPKDKLEFMESVDVNYNLVCLSVAECNRFCQQLFNVPCIAAFSTSTVNFIQF